MDEVVRVKIKNGKAEIVVEGVVGTSCHDKTRALLAKLGKRVDVQNTVDYYLDEEKQEVRQNAG